MDTSFFFDTYFDLAQINCMLIMDSSGMILKVNKAFTKNYFYTSDDLNGRYFDVLFTQKDRDEGKPGLELQTVAKLRQSNDENFIVDKNGVPVWSTGESILVDDGDGRQFILKDIINLQSKRQLQLFLNQTEELLERVFSSSREVPMLILDGSMKVVRYNEAFQKFFNLSSEASPGSRLSDIDHPFWSSSMLKTELANILITNSHFETGPTWPGIMMEKRRQYSLTQGSSKAMQNWEKEFLSS